MAILFVVSVLLVAAGIGCMIIGVIVYLNREVATAASAAGPGRAQPTNSRAAFSAQPPNASAAPQKTGHAVHDQFIQARLGQTITVTHPQRGPITGKILGTIYYTELTQKRNTPAEPWLPTGNVFVAHWLGNLLVYMWQDRLYLLDELEPLSDQDVQTSFMPYAKRFAQSNQTAHVVFDWPPASWVIKDIGKFSVAQAQGNGLRLNPGAVGRFIHGEGADQRAIVVEDYQSGGGGQDTAWTGWAIAWNDVTRIV
jgi:hypothetical protein